MALSSANRASWLIALCASCAALGCGQASEPTEATSEALINGRLAADSDYPSTVFIWGVCTATKVGARLFLTAAHCVTSYIPEPLPEYQPGNQIHISASRALGSQPSAIGKVVRTTVIPAWMAAKYPTGMDAPDVAVIEIDADTPSIPAAVVDSSPVAAGDPLVMLGYGCTAPLKDDYGTLHLGDQVAVAGGVAPLPAEDYAGNVVTLGPAEEPSRPGMCAGDSGGPLFRPGSNWLVGVATVSLSGEPDGPPNSNLDTRLDASSQNGANAFLRGLGVNMGQSLPTAVAFGGTPHAIPGVIQAEDFDLGGQGLGYSDNDDLNRPQVNFRTEGVDLDDTADEGGGYNVGGTKPGEWLAFTSEVVADGLYDIELRYAAETAGRVVRVEVDGSDVSGPITLPSTGGWQLFDAATKTGVVLTQGKHSVRVVFETGEVNLNWLRFTQQLCLTACGGGTGGQSAAGSAGQGAAGAPVQAGNGNGAGGALPNAGAGVGGASSAGAGETPSAGAGGVVPAQPLASTRAPSSSCSLASLPGESRSQPALLPAALALLALRRRRPLR